MIKFVSFSVLFVLPLLLLAIGTELFVRSIPNQYSFKKERINICKNRIETLVLGNSHALYGINTSNIPNAFNLAFSAQRLEYDYYFLSKYIEKVPNLKNVFLNIDHSNLFLTDLENSSSMNWNLAIYYNLYMDYPKHGVFSKYHYELSCPKFLFKKLLTYTCSLITGNNMKIGCDSTGFGDSSERMRKKKQSDMNEKPVNIRQMGKRNTIENYPVNLAYIDSLAILCQSHHIRLIVVATPYWHLYASKLDKRKTELLDRTFRYLTYKYGVSCKNYINDTRLSNKDNYFYNADHLGPEGANVFTSILKSDFSLE